MLAGIFHEGSGLGNQLHRYVATRVAALDLGYEFGMVHPENFKGTGFMNLDMGLPVEEVTMSSWKEKRVNHPNGTDIRPYDPGIKALPDNTLIDGEFQDPKYFMHRIDEVREWLHVEPQRFNIAFCKPEEVCLLNLRGGEYVGVPDLFLPREYWYTAMDHMRKVNPKMKFGVVTDDPETAQKFFPNFDIRHDGGFDWVALNNAHHLILSNSSFAILPTLLNRNVKTVIAPKYWARHNVSDGYWALEQNKYPGWYYQDRDGSIELYEGDS